MICLYELVRIKISRRCNGYFLRWWYNGWHYWLFRTGSIAFVTGGEKYRTLGTQKMTIGTGQINESESNAIRTILNTREVSIYTSSGWGVVRVEPGSMIVYDHALHGYEAEITIIIGSKQVSKTGFSPAKVVPVVVPSVVYCEVVIGTQVWMCKNWDAAYPGSRVYDGDEDNRALFGGLYTFDQISTPGFVPDGWHVPTLAEWMTLINFAGGLAVAGGTLRETGVIVWDAPNTGATDDYGFKAVGGGVHGVTGDVYYALGISAYIWTASSDPVYTNSKAIIRIDYNSTVLSVTYFESAPNHLASVRLIKDTAAPTLYDDWFLGSLLLLQEAYNNLKLFGLGSFSNTIYSSSSSFYEDSNDFIKSIDFTDGSLVYSNKADVLKVRAFRSFTDVVGAYSLRDTGPAGGLICYIDGTIYYEAAPSDLTDSAWSNLSIDYIVTEEAIADSQANTTAIIAQPGHTTSAAKLCNDLVI